MARQLNGILAQAAASVSAGTSVGIAEEHATTALLTAGFRQIDYVAIRRADTLATFEGPVDAPARILAAAWLGKTRLIDNLPI